MSGENISIKSKMRPGKFKKGAKRTLEQSIEDALIKDDMCLLDVVFDSANVVGDAAALWSKGILKILNSGRIEKDNVQEFLKRALRNRIRDYRAKSRDLSDITRDNSLVTMLLTAYARSEGESFLSQTLTKPLNSIYPLLSKCEVDPQKLSKGQPINSSQEFKNLENEITANRLNLEQVCEKVFQTIFESREKLPLTILSMCCFLTDTIEETSSIDPASIKRKVSSEETHIKTGITQPNQPSSPLLPHSRTSVSMFRIPARSSTTAQGKPPSASFSNHLATLLIKRKKPHGSKDNVSIVPSIENSFVSRTESFTEKGPDSALPITMNTPLSLKTDVNSKKSDDAKTSPTSAHPTDNATTVHRLSKSSFELALSIPVPSSPVVDGILSNITHSMSTPIIHPPKGASRSRSGSFANLLQHDSKNPRGSAGMLGTLAVSEKIIGSFLFLRFIVPGITSPDLNGIMMEKITPAVRRGLILCGKMMTALCNDTEFGYKETSLMPCNPFLEKYRYMMKDFLSKSAQMVEKRKTLSYSDGDLRRTKSDDLMSVKSNTDLKESSSKCTSAIPTSSDLHSRAASHPIPQIDQPIFEESSLVKQKSKTLSRSMEHLKTIPSSALGSTEHDKSYVDPDIRAFYRSLSTTLDKLEREISAKKSILALEEYQVLVKNYGELRIYLNTGGYVEESDQNFKSKKTWWVKMISYLGKHH